MRHCALSLGTLLIAGCSLAPQPKEDPVQTQIADLNARVARIERVLSNQSLVEMSQRLEALEAQVRSLQGSSEVEENTLSKVQKQQRDLYADLDRRLAAIEAGMAPTSGADTAAGGAGRAAPPPLPEDATEQQTYDDAFAALKDARYAEAIAGFTGFLGRWPDSALAPNSAYWLGEAYYVTKDYEQAAASFSDVASRWPKSAKAPGALLKLGFAQYELRRFDAARETFAQLIERYPDSDSAKLAQERLRRMNSAQT
jgi:tol-pal system protein YbgF